MVLRTALALIALIAAFAAAAKVWAGEPVELNTATPAQLMQLPGVGQKRAADIIRQRKIRPFRRTSDLLRIKGIGRRTYLKLKPLVQVLRPGEAKKETRQPCKEASQGSK